MSIRRFVTAIAAAGAVFAAVAFAKAETWTLELKRQESNNQNFGGMSFRYGATSPQQIFIPMMLPGNRGRNPQSESQAAAFKRLVTKEPKYQSDSPLRGVVKLGSQEYAFAVDGTPVNLEANDGKSESAKAKPDSAIARLTDKLVNAASPKRVNYNRLYFDFNQNGDLTDDKVVEAESQSGSYAAMPYGMHETNSSRPQTNWYSHIRFPRIDLTIDVDGKPLNYSFFLTGFVQVSQNYSYANIMINAATLREGDITLDGKKHHVVLVDFNSNGRFDDQANIRRDVRTPDGRLFPQQGDMLLIDPDVSNTGRTYDSFYDPTGSSYRHYVSNLIWIDGRFYNLKISPAGDKLTLNPSSAPLGSVTNPNDDFTAIVYGAQGFLKISGKKGKPVAIPEGKWKLLSYTIHDIPAQQPGETADKKKEEALKEVATIGELGTQLLALFGGGAPAMSRPRYSFVSAQATRDYKAITVRKGETVELPFGPPYKAMVKADFFANRDQNRQLSLSMSLIGSAGEVCTVLMVDGQPPRPEFTIAGRAGKVVQQGYFDTRGGFPCRYLWRVPSAMEDAYHIHVKMQAGPLAIDPKNDSVIYPWAVQR
jgi:hypothetical protein